MNIYYLENKFNKIGFLDVGATIYSWQVKHLNNRNIVLSNADLQDYFNAGSSFLGATVGRVANRIKDGRFSLDGKNYQLDKNFDGGFNAGHGGPDGFWRKTFTLVESSSTHLEFKLLSPDGDQGYPGNLELGVIYTLLEQGLRIDYHVNTDTKTIVNITNHSYFNLDGSNTVLDHVLDADFSHYLPFDKNKAVTGQKIKVENSALDFSGGVRIKDIIYDDYLQDKNTLGLDHCVYFKDEKKVKLMGKDLILELTTSYPCIQLYGTSFPSPQKLLGHDKMHLYHALALEPQLAVDAINFPDLGSIILSPDQEYHHFIEYKLKDQSE